MITTKPVNDLEELGYNLEDDDGSALIITKELAQQLHDTMLAFVILKDQLEDASGGPKSAQPNPLSICIFFPHTRQFSVNSLSPITLHNYYNMY